MVAITAGAATTRLNVFDPGNPSCFKQVYVWYRCAAGTNFSDCAAVTDELVDKHYTVQTEDVGFSLTESCRR